MLQGSRLGANNGHNASHHTTMYTVNYPVNFIKECKLVVSILSVYAHQRDGCLFTRNLVSGERETLID
jgi:hypothetical protein